MKFEIKSRWHGSVLFAIETDSWKLAVEAAVKSGADLSGADLSSADLSGADLSSASLSRADFSSARNADLAQAQTSITPEGHNVGWKKCRNGVIVKLLIPQKAPRSNSTGRK